jgi:hypothetical protein
MFNKADNFAAFDGGFVDELLHLMITDEQFMAEWRARIKPELFSDDLRSTLARCALSFYEEHGCVAQKLFIDSVLADCAARRTGDARMQLLEAKAHEVFKCGSGNSQYIISRLEEFFQFTRLKSIRYQLDQAIDAGDLGAASKVAASLAEDPLTPAEEEAASEPADPKGAYGAKGAGRISERERPVLASEAFYGLAGEFARAIDPYTEADLAATLTNTLTIFGNGIGPGPHAVVACDKHPARLFMVQVGPSGGGRKGLGLSAPRRLMAMCEPIYTAERIYTGGLSTGEGLKWQVRDARTEKKADPNNKANGTRNYVEEIVDHGVDDKRLLAIEPEYGSMLKKMARDKNCLSGDMRAAYDSGDLSNLTVSRPLRVTGAHISIIGHTTPEELRSNLTETERCNGFANRFLWIWSERSKFLPEGPAIPDSLLEKYAQQLRKALSFARNTGVVTRDPEAAALWAHVYPHLVSVKSQPGLTGAILSRAEAQVLRISLTYALLDLSAEIRVEHLLAALAVWDYCVHTTYHIFGDRLGNPDAEKILDLLKEEPEGYSEKEISEKVFSNHRVKAKNDALRLLVQQGLVVKGTQATSGKYKAVYKLAAKADSHVRTSFLAIAKEWLASRDASPAAPSAFSAVSAGSPAVSEFRTAVNQAVAAWEAETGAKVIPCSGMVHSAGTNYHIRRVVEEHACYVTVEVMEMNGVFRWDRQTGELAAATQ